MTIGAELLTAAQILFMLLPLCALFAMRSGTPVAANGPRIVSAAAAMTAFALLVAMFYQAASLLGVTLCGANLGLRLVEAVRLAQLHRRHRLQTAAEGSLLNSDRRS